MRFGVGGPLPVVAFLLILGGICASAQPPQPAKAAPKAGTEMTNSIGMKLLYIPAGTFLMGSPSDEKGRFDDEVQHEVEITKGYYLGKYEVTQDEYQALMGKNTSAFKGPKHPAETLTWNEAKEFCRLLSLKEGKGGKDGRGAGGYRLPTEAEWERACRAETTSSYHVGETLSLKQANYLNPNKLETVAVGTYPPNAWGLHDMHGNVWEWCEDGYVPQYAKNLPKQDPKGATNSGGYYWHVVRGGSWGVDPAYCRSAARFGNSGGKAHNIGFRVALPSVE